MVRDLLLLSILSALAYTAPSPSQENSNAVSAGCTKLAAKYPALTFLPNSTEYNSQTANVWSQTCVLYPYCIFEPESADDVAGGLKILNETNTKFSVRSGGHMARPGANGIADGVMIATARLLTTELVEDNTVAKLGAGLRWGAVYAWISQYGLAIAGGRFGDVGVPGLLLGGGISWFGSEVGWAADTVRNFEVVLADGSIVNANASGEYSDLFWALKGGSSNFGIVTRFDCATIPVTDIYGGMQYYTYTPEEYGTYLQAVANYIDPSGGSSDVKSSLDPITVVSPSTGDVIVAAFFSRRDNDPSPACFSNFTALNASVSTLRVSSSFAEFQADANTTDFSDRTHRQLAWVTGLKATAESVYLANETFFGAAFAQLADIPNATTSITYQAISQWWLEAAQESGGDAIDLDPADGGLIAVQIESIWLDSQYDSRFAQFSTDMVAAIDAKAKAAGLYYPFNYINDAGFTQNIFSYYGGGKSLPKMKAIAEKYDPSGVFQTLQPGGFKIFAE